MKNSTIVRIAAGTAMIAWLSAPVMAKDVRDKGHKVVVDESLKDWSPSTTLLSSASLLAPSATHTETVKDKGRIIQPNEKLRDTVRRR